jgi:hypothetical protein
VIYLRQPILDPVGSAEQIEHVGRPPGRGP